MVVYFSEHVTDIVVLVRYKSWSISESVTSEAFIKWDGVITVYQ